MPVDYSRHNNKMAESAWKRLIFLDMRNMQKVA
jgi:hypothetical protein